MKDEGKFKRPNPIEQLQAFFRVMYEIERDVPFQNYSVRGQEITIYIHHSILSHFEYELFKASYTKIDGYYQMYGYRVSVELYRDKIDYQSNLNYQIKANSILAQENKLLQQYIGNLLKTLNEGS